MVIHPETHIFGLKTAKIWQILLTCANMCLNMPIFAQKVVIRPEMHIFGLKTAKIWQISLTCGKMCLNMLIFA